jgi:tetratricopeptide (TPR) repeat protein
MRPLAVVLCLAASATTTFADDGSKDIARAYFQAGVAFYDQGKYEQALNEFQRAQAMSHNAELYFNMAACEEHMDHYQAAAVFLRQYLLEKPTAPDKDNVMTRIKALEQREERVHREDGSVVGPSSVDELQKQQKELEQKYQRLQQQQKDEQEQKKKAAAKKPIGGFIALGVTAALGIGAIATGSYTVVSHNDLKKGCGATVDGCTSGDIDGLKGAAAGTDALIALTAAAAVATVIVFVLETRAHKKAQAAADQHAAITPGFVF